MVEKKQAEKGPAAAHERLYQSVKEAGTRSLRTSGSQE
jgi:hypothetical protein